MRRGHAVQFGHRASRFRCRTARRSHVAAVNAIVHPHVLNGRDAQHEVEPFISIRKPSQVRELVANVVRHPGESFISECDDRDWRETGGAPLVEHAPVIQHRASVEYSRVAVRHRGHPLEQPRILDDTLIDPGAVPTVFAVARLDASFDRKPFGRIVAVRVRPASTLRPHACFRSSESTSKVRERSERRSRHISLQEVSRGAL